VVPRSSLLSPSALEPETLDLPTPGAQAFLLRAPQARLAAVFNHGNPGVPAYLRDLAQRMASSGITVAVVAGDGRIEPRPLASFTESERAEWRTEEFAERYLQMTREAVTLMSGNGRPALVGFCGGGWQALRLAAEGLAVSRVVAVHAALRFPPEDPRGDLLDYLPHVRVPVQFHFGGADDLTPPVHIAELGDRQDIYVYPNAGHGFLDPQEQGDEFDPSAADTAIDRIIDFLARDA
jgi:carboxymethylenebutenolidase